MNISEVSGADLDCYVAKMQGFSDVVTRDGKCIVAEKGKEKYWYSPSHNWALGGPLIEKELMTLLAPHTEHNEGAWWKAICGGWEAGGATLLEAAMRCYVCSKYGACVL